MNTFARTFGWSGLCLGTLLAAAGLVPHNESALAIPAPALPCTIIQHVETDSPRSYAMWIAETNRIIKDKFGVDSCRHVFIGESAGPDSGAVFAVTRGESFTALQANDAAFEKEQALTDARLQLNQIRKLGANVSYKAVRFDGVHPEAWLSNTKMVVHDEPAYLKALDQMRATLDGNGFKDIKINCHRVAAGRTDWTHMASLNCPSRERRAALMDAFQCEPWALEWISSVAKLRTVVANGTYREMTLPAAQ
jgi:hypothetical protein